MKQLLEAIEKDSLVEVKRLLKEHTYDLNKDIAIGTEYELDEYDEIPLLFYLIQKHASLEMIKLLVEHGMNLHKTTKEGVGAIDIAIKYHRLDVLKYCKEQGIDIINSQRKSGLTPLMLATCFNDIEIMQYLLKNGANIEQRDSFGMNALDYAKKMRQKSAMEFLQKYQENS